MGVVDVPKVEAFCSAVARRLGVGGGVQEDDAGRTASTFRLNEAEVYELLDLVGLAHGPAAFLATDAEKESRLAWADAAAALTDDDGRLLLKIVGRDILHKSDIGGVRLLRVDPSETPAQLLQHADALRATVTEAADDARIEGVLACGYVAHSANQPGQELLLSLRHDPAFGPVVVVGLGGTLTEWYGHGTGGRSRLIFPARTIDAAAVAAALRAHPLLSMVCQPSRLYDEAPVDVEQISGLVLGLAALGNAFHGGSATRWNLEEIELNPVVASVGRLVALDGVGLVGAQKWAASRRPLNKIVPLLAPHSAVVLGVSAKGHNPGRIILDNLRKSAGIARDRLYVVHQKEAVIDTVPCFPAVSDLPEKCDLAVVAIPAEGALTAIRELVENDRAESIILIPGGFAEAGQNTLAAAIEDVLAAGHEAPGGGPIMVGGNCLGIVSRDQYNTFFLPEYKLPFRPGRGPNLALVSQSGAYLVTFASNYDGIIYPKTSISFGNQMDLTVADFLEHFVGDEDVDVIACYVEGFRPGDGVRFLAMAREAARRHKRVVIFKAGKTALGAQAAASHTASLAGDYDVARAALQSVGVTVAETLDEFEDLIKTFTLLAGKPISGRRAGIISNAGFECSTVMDQLGTLELATFDAPAQAEIDAALPGFAHRTNPIDCTPMTGTDAFARSTRAILNCPDVDVAIISAVPVTPALDNLEPDRDGRHRENLYADGSQPKRLIEIMQAAPKPGVVVIDSGSIYDPMATMIERAGIPVFRKIDRAAKALAALCAAP